MKVEDVFSSPAIIDQRNEGATWASRIVAARTERELRSVTTPVGRQGRRGILHFHLTAWDGSRSHPAGSISGLGYCTEGRASGICSHLDVVLRPCDIQNIVRIHVRKAQKRPKTYGRCSFNDQIKLALSRGSSRPRFVIANDPRRITCKKISARWEIVLPLVSPCHQTEVGNRSFFGGN